LRSHDTIGVDAMLEFPSNATDKGAGPDPALNPSRATGGVGGAAFTVTVTWLIALPAELVVVNDTVKSPAFR
jgi:hypothetical protein